MRVSLIAPVALLLCVGCKKERSEKPETKPAVKPVAMAEAAPQDAGFSKLTPEAVDRYLAYRKAMTEIHRTLLPKLDALDAQAKKAKDAGAVAEAGLKLVGAEAKAQEDAQKASGLSQAELDRIDELVQAFVQDREMAEDTASADQLKGMEDLAKKLPGDQRVSFEKSIADLKAQREQSEKLSDLRAEYGSDDVDALLSREQEVIRTWDAWVHVLAGVSQ